MQIKTVKDLEDLLSQGSIYGTITDGRYQGSVGLITKIAGINFKPEHVFWKEGNKGVVPCKTSWGSVDTDLGYTYYLQFSVKLTTPEGKTTTVKARAVDVEVGDFTPKFCDKSLDRSADVKDIFGRVLAAGNLVAFVQSNSMDAGVVEKVNYLGDVYIKTLDGKKTIAKVMENNCVIIDRNVEDVALVYKLTR